MKGRQVVMASAACLNGIGDLWLCLSAFLPPIRTPYSLLFSAFIKGLGGSFSVVQATTARSFYLGLALVMFWFASALAPLGVSIILLGDHYATCFGIATACWVIYFLYAVFILKETRIP
ncbi:hypothetical protein QCA50_006476 [Cerrena zonata]|uniref:Uncharacterized protein n=1 Tax=Cerrena zonata TaxID=2478898 RepID=A0AAW0GE54_9APHY